MKKMNTPKNIFRPVSHNLTYVASITRSNIFGMVFAIHSPGPFLGLFLED